MPRHVKDLRPRIEDTEEGLEVIEGGTEGGVENFDPLLVGFGEGDSSDADTEISMSDNDSMASEYETGDEVEVRDMVPQRSGRTSSPLILVVEL